MFLSTLLDAIGVSIRTYHRWIAITAKVLMNRPTSVFNSKRTVVGHGPIYIVIPVY